MKFPFDEVRKIIGTVENRFYGINAGGCGIMAYILARQLRKVAETRIVIHSWFGGSIDKVRPLVNKNTLREWNAHNIHIYHAWVEFKVNNRWYGIDSTGLRTRKATRIMNGKPCSGTFTLQEMCQMSHCRSGWNTEFDRKQIPALKRIVNTKLNELFGV